MHNTPVLFFRSFCLLSSPFVQQYHNFCSIISFIRCLWMCMHWHAFFSIPFRLKSHLVRLDFGFRTVFRKRYICKLWGNGCSIFGMAVINGTATIIIMICDHSMTSCLAFNEKNIRKIDANAYIYAWCSGDTTSAHFYKLFKQQPLKTT